MKRHEPNYKGFLAPGITFMGAGVALMTTVNLGVGMGLIGAGIVFLAIGSKKK